MSTPARPIEVKAEEVGVLANAFPMPIVHTVTITKPVNGPVGIRYKGQVEPDITNITKSSPLQGTVLRPGLVILAVNGVKVTPNVSVGDMIKRVPGGAALTFVCREQPTKESPFFKTIVAPSWKHHPGVAFAATRGETLVQVSRVFQKGPFTKKGLNVGDIVLAINGAPVSKVYQADQYLQWSRQEPLVILHVADIAAIRKYVHHKTGTKVMSLKELDGTEDLKRGAFGKFFLGKNFADYQTDNYSHALFVHKNCKTFANFDTNTQHISDPEKYSHLTTDMEFTNGNLSTVHSHKVELEQDYVHKVIPYMKKFNDIMDQEMSYLEEAVACETYQYADRIGVDGNATTTMFADAVVTAHAQVLPFTSLQRKSELGLVISA